MNEKANSVVKLVSEQNNISQAEYESSIGMVRIFREVVTNALDELERRLVQMRFGESKSGDPK